MQQTIYQAIVFRKEDLNYCFGYQVLSSTTAKGLRFKILNWVNKEFDGFFEDVNSSIDFIKDDDDESLDDKIWERKEILEKENDGESFDFHFMDDCFVTFNEKGSIEDLSV